MAQGWMWPGTSRNAAQQWGNLNPALRNRLRSFYDHAEKSGYATAARPISSYRTREDQIRAGRQVAARLDRTYDPNVGIPGYAASADGSRHRRGEAIDWTFRNPEAQKWFHENAKNYGLAFPIETDAPHMQLVRDWNGELKPVTPEGNPAAGSFRAAQESGFNDTAPAPQVAGYVARETNQGQSMADRQPPSMFGALARGFSSPQFMAGAAMFDSALRGGGIAQGAQMLRASQQQEQEMAYRQAQQQRMDEYRQQQMGMERERLDLAKQPKPIARPWWLMPDNTMHPAQKKYLEMQRAGSGPNADLVRRKLELQVNALDGKAKLTPMQQADLERKRLELEVLRGALGGTPAQPGAQQQLLQPQSNVAPPSVQPMANEQPQSDDPNLIRTQTAPPSASQQPPMQLEGMTIGGMQFKRPGAAQEAWTTPTANKIDEKIFNTVEQATRLDDISSKFKPEFQTIAGGAKALGAKWWEKAMGEGSLDPETQQYLKDFASHKMAAIVNINDYIKETTGAQMSEAEAKRLRQGMPDPGDDMFSGDSPSEFKRKLDDKHKMMRLAMARYSYLRSGKWKGGTFTGKLESGKEPISLKQMEGIMDDRATSLMQEAKSRHPNGDHRFYVRERLKQEFGI